MIHTHTHIYYVIYPHCQDIFFILAFSLQAFFGGAAPTDPLHCQPRRAEMRPATADIIYIYIYIILL